MIICSSLTGFVCVFIRWPTRLQSPWGNITSLSLLIVGHFTGEWGLITHSHSYRCVWYISSGFSLTDLCFSWVVSSAKKEDADEEIAKYDGTYTSQMSCRFHRTELLTGVCCEQVNGRWRRWRTVSCLGIKVWSWSLEPNITPSPPSCSDLSSSTPNRSSSSKILRFLPDVTLCLPSHRCLSPVFRYEVNFQSGIDCGGAYVKLLCETPEMTLVSWTHTHLASEESWSVVLLTLWEVQMFLLLTDRLSTLLDISTSSLVCLCSLICQARSLRWCFLIRFVFWL